MTLLYILMMNHEYWEQTCKRWHERLVQPWATHRLEVCDHPETWMFTLPPQEPTDDNDMETR